MPNRFAELRNGPGLAVALLALASMLLQIFENPGILADPFHQGEYFAAAASYMAEGAPQFHPLAIHGAMDYLPAMLAERVWGPDNYLLPTLFLYQCLAFASALLLLGIAWSLTRARPDRRYLLLGIAVASPLLVGARDLLLLAGIYQFVLMIETPDGSRKAVLLQIGIGICVALGLFWCFDRGIAGAVSLGAAALVLLPDRRSVLWSLGSLVATVLILAFSFEGFALRDYVHDVLLLMGTSAQWSYGWGLGHLINMAIPAALTATALWLLVSEAWHAGQVRRRLPLLVAFSLLCVFMLKIGTNRADLEHVSMALWMPMLVALCLEGRKVWPALLITLWTGLLFVGATPMAVHPPGYGIAFAAGALCCAAWFERDARLYRAARALFVVLVVATIAQSAYLAIHARLQQGRGWITTLAAAPHNRAASPDGVVWAADRLGKLGAHCVFDLSNNGILNALVRRPACTTFTYPVYAGPQHESQLIEQLRAAAPSALVYSSTFWSYAIDGKPMHDRFPALDEFIVRNYPQLECSLGYCIRHAQR